MTNKKWLERGGGDVATELSLLNQKISSPGKMFCEFSGGKRRACCGGKGLFD
jgi:hypothetical protein